MINYAEERVIQLEDIKKGNIPLIVSPDGSPLLTLSQSPEWLKLYQKAHGSRKIRRRAGGLVSRDADSSDPDESHVPKQQRASSGRKRTKKATSSNYVDISEESDDEDLPYPDINRKRKQKHSRSRHGPGHESYDSDGGRVRKRKKENRQISEESSDNDGLVAKSRVEKMRNEQGSSHNPEGRIKKGKSKHNRAEHEESVDRRSKGKKKAVPTTSDDSASRSDEDTGV